MKEMKSDNGFTSMSEMAKICIQNIQTRAKNVDVLGVPSGFRQLDNLIDGFEKGKIYIIGGRPCMGKEEFILSMIGNIITEDVPVLLFSTNHMKSDYVQSRLSVYFYIRTLFIDNRQMVGYYFD